MVNNNCMQKIFNKLHSNIDIIMWTFKRCMKEKLIVLNDHLDNIFNHRFRLLRTQGKSVKTSTSNNRIKSKKCNTRMLDHKSHQWIEMEINQEGVSKMQISLQCLKQRYKNSLHLKIILESKRTRMPNRLWTNIKPTWNTNLQGMNKNKSNNLCRDKIYSTNWERIYLELKRRPLMVTLCVMLSGDFGQLIMKDMLIPKWKMNWLFSRRKSSKDLKVEIYLNPLQCLELVAPSILNYIKSTIW